MAKKTIKVSVPADKSDNYPKKKPARAKAGAADRKAGAPDEPKKPATCGVSQDQALWP